MRTIKQLNILVKRILKQNLTDSDTLITVIGTPVFMLLFFVYVFGGSITLGNNNSNYLNYALPGFLLITMAMASGYTALRINVDKTTGYLDRLHTLPIKRWLILASHIIASVIFMLISGITVFIVGLIMGYRPDFEISKFLLFVVLIILFAIAITLLALPFSLKAKNWQSASGFSYILLMLLFVSSGFVPTDGMATPIKFFAEHQPMTPIVNATRSLLLDENVSSSLLFQSFAWILVAIIICSFFSYKRYQKVFQS